MKKFFLALVCFFAINSFVYADFKPPTQPETGTPANSYFDDYNFYKCIVNGYNDTFNSLYIATEYSLSDDELASIKSLSCNNQNINNTNGIEKLEGLKELYIADNNFKSIDLSNNMSLRNLYIDEDVELIGVNDNLNIEYNYPTYIFNNSDLKYDPDVYEYTINVGNNVTKFMAGWDMRSRSYRFDCQDDNVLCGGSLLVQAVFEGLEVTVNGVPYNLMERLNSLSHGPNDLCDSTYPCDKTFGSLHFVANSSSSYTFYENNDIYYSTDDDRSRMLLKITDLSVGTTVVTLNMNNKIYTLNIVRSDKEIDNNPNEELNNLIENIILDNNVKNPDTGNYLSLIISGVAIALVGFMYYLFYKKVKKNS